MDAYFKSGGVEKTLRSWEEEWDPPYKANEDSVNTAKMFEDWESKAATPSLEREPKASHPLRADRVPRGDKEPPKLGLDETGTIDQGTRGRRC